jgi:hypothetical protein
MEYPTVLTRLNRLSQPQQQIGYHMILTREVPGPIL